MRKINFLTIPILFIGLQVSAQQRQWDRPMQLKNCLIDIKADLFTATTFIEMEFFNPNNQEIEGMHRFELKPGQVITAFQLDLHGKYRDGSIEEKWKATNAYNTIVGKRIDPALLTMEYRDHYRLNIYPVPAKSSRKVTMTIRQLLVRDKYNLLYALPLNIPDTVRQFSLNISAAVKTIPVTRAGLIAGLAFINSNQQFSLQWNKENIMLKSPVVFSIPMPSTPVLCIKTVEKRTHFGLNFRPSFPAEYDVHPKRITIFWDASASAAKRNVSKEISYLKQFISFHKVEKVTIIPFNHRLTDTAIFYTENILNSQWQQYLQNMNYQGATQLGNIDLSGNGSDMFILFTDGNNTYGRGKPRTGTGLVYCVYSSNAVNTGVLNQIVGASGGKVVDLNKATVSSAIAINSKAENWLLNITSASGTVITEQSLPMKINRPLLINGMLNNGNDTFYFHYGNNNHVNQIEMVVLNPGNQCASSAIDRISMLNNFDQMIRSSSWEDILDFGLNEKIVTPNTAFIVLERVEDYIKYNIAPPDDLQEECERMNYVRKDTRPGRQKSKESDEFAALSSVINTYNDRIKKWDGHEKAILFNRTDFEKEKQLQRIERAANPQPINVDAGQNTVSGISDKASALQEVVVVGYGTASKSSLTGSVVSIGSRDLVQSFGTVEQALQGRVAGLQVTPSNDAGFMNDQFKVNIRGISSLSGSNEPLYVLDGIPVSGNINNYISLNDIESISVLKDIQAGALYGSRAANGAIVITSKKWRSYYRNSNKPYRLKDMEDVEYLQLIREAAMSEKKLVYRQLKDQYEDNPGFYFDMAQHFFEIGLKNEAMEELMNAAEASNGSYQVLRAVGYVLESWKQFDEAARVYEQLLADYPNNLCSHRDLAWAYYQDGKLQEAANVLYGAIKNDVQYAEWWNQSLKAMMLSELNAMIALHQGVLDISAIPSVLIRPMPVDLRIILDCNKGNLGSVSIKEPGGATCSYSKPITKSGGVLSVGQHGYYHGGPAEYRVKQAQAGKYRVSLNYYDYYSYPGKIPAFIRMVTFRNFGKANQSITVENVIMDNQYGDVEIGEIKW